MNISIYIYENICMIIYEYRYIYIYMYICVVNYEVSLIWRWFAFLDDTRWFGTYFFDLSIQLGISTSQLTNSYFSEKVKPPTRNSYRYINLINHSEIEVVNPLYQPNQPQWNWSCKRTNLAFTNWGTTI